MVIETTNELNVSNACQSIWYKRPYFHLLSGMLILTSFAPSAAQGQTIELTDSLKNSIEQAERALDKTIASPRDFKDMKEDIALAEDLAALRSQEQGTDWWETRDAWRRVDNLKRIEAMRPEQREELVEVGKLRDTVYQLNQQHHYSQAFEPAERLLQTLQLHRRLPQERSRFRVQTAQLVPVDLPVRRQARAARCPTGGLRSRYDCAPKRERDQRQTLACSDRRRLYQLRSRP